MPNCFNLTKIGQTEPTALATVDEEICALLNIPVHPKNWAVYWYDAIGAKIAIRGWSLDQIIEHYEAEIAREEAEKKEGYEECVAMERDWVRIAQYLKENYMTNAWVEIGNRR